ncbi:type II toxin-antitoxin system HipA family toxin [Roseateles saccharophilus]|uniref:type II toxin-antitoxin system HipA family toxin n=1 Tax=Roseateles saccharophilus TaxID=304 RepID=UPI001A9ECA24|nr:type II toxin-antitoxin system HipA family toxin [Roseateles saccharophilus]
MAEQTPAVLVSTPQGLAGRLQREGDYVFSFDPAAGEQAAPALGMPRRLKPYVHKSLHPVFQMNLPEGYVLEQLRQRLAKTTGIDPLLLLTVVGSQAPIGRLRFAAEGPVQASTAPQGESLADLLASKGSRDLFARLVDTYLMRSGLSGVQPKVLVPEIPTGLPAGEFKAALATSELIVKSGLGEFPGLAVNEFFCMTVVKRAGIPVPEFFLSEDGELFIMRRFDRPGGKRILGFEDMLVLAGRDADQKYVGSYSLALKLLHHYCSPEHWAAARQQLFDMVALSCILGNGDAHLKNFGVLYEDVTGAVAMAPAYDIVCTKLYIPEDNLALELVGNRSFFAARQGLLDFGNRCDIPKAKVKTRLIELASTALRTLDDLAPLVEKLPGLDEIIRREAHRYLETFQ